MTRKLVFVCSNCSIFVLALALLAFQAPAEATVLITDTYSRDTSGTGGWGAADNQVVGGETGTVAASYVPAAAGAVDGSTGTFTNNRVILDYNLAADPDVIAGGGFLMEWQVNPTDGDDAAGQTGTGREFAGVGLSDTSDTAIYGGAGAITNAANDALRFALLPRNSGSTGNLTRTAGNVRTLTATGNPTSGGFNEVVFDQPVFDDYVAMGTPDPFVNNKFYDVSLKVVGDFTAASNTVVTATVNGLTLAPFSIEWGDAGQAYVSAVGFNGPHQYDNLKITALPEPSSFLLIGMGGLMLLRRRS